MDHREITFVVDGDRVGGGPPGLLRFKGCGRGGKLIHFDLETARAIVQGAPGAPDSQALDLLGDLMGGQIARLFQFPGAHCHGEQRRGLRGTAARKQQQGRQGERKQADQSTNCSELRYNFEVNLGLFNDWPAGATQSHFERFTKERVLERLREIDAHARKGGLRALDAADPLVGIGVETDASGKVTKNSYGVLNLGWQAELHPEWPGQVAAEVA